MLYEFLSNRSGWLRFLRQRRDTGRRRRRLAAEQLPEHPLASLDRAGAVVLRREREKARLGQEAHARRITEVDFAEARRRCTGDSIELRQPRIGVGVLRGEQLVNVFALVEERLEEELGL